MTGAIAKKALPSGELGCLISALRGLDQFDFDDVGPGDSPVSFVGQNRPPFIGHVAAECLGRREFQKLDLKRLAVCSAAPRALENPAAVLGNEAQNPVLVGGEGVVGAWSRPQQDTKGQAHRRPREPQHDIWPDKDSSIAAKYPIAALAGPSPLHPWNGSADGGRAAGMVPVVDGQSVPDSRAA